MTHQCRMGYAPAIDYLPLETRKSHKGLGQHMPLYPLGRPINADDGPDPAQVIYDMWAANNEFEGRQHNYVRDGAVLRLITEADCRQVKPKAIGVDWASGPDMTATLVLNGFPIGTSGQILRMNTSGGWEWTVAPAAPPSTTDKPQGVWVKTSERKPPKPGAYAVRVGRAEYSGDEASYWDGEVWHMEPHKSSRVCCSQNWEWLDETPQADAGWIKHSDGRIPVGPDVMVEARLRDGYTERLPARCWAWRIFGDGNPHDITAYRIVKEQD